MTLGQTPAQAAPALHGRTASCSTIPALVNGGFEEFSNPDDGGVANNKPTNNGYGWWHGYGYGDPSGAPGPDQILFLKSGDPSVPSNFVTGWRTTDAQNMIEIQRQVSSYTASIDGTGVQYGPYSPERSGVATPTTYLQNGYWDKYGPQPAQGTYWAELNALTDSALYQDVAVSTGDQMFWSIKHRGRTENNEEMKVMIGPAGSLVQQTTIDKYAPVNADRFVGYPTYGSTPTSVSRIITPLNSGWTRYEGAYTATATGPLRFQFQAVGGTPWGNAFGNLLDDVQFTVFLACPASRSLQVGQSVTVDVGTAPLSYGIRQQLTGVSNTTAPSSEFSTSGNSVIFTPSAAGTFTADYTVEMAFGGLTYSRTSTLTYTVTAPPAPPTPPAPPAPAQTDGPIVAPPTDPTPAAPTALTEPAIRGAVVPGGSVSCDAPAFTPAPDSVHTELTLGTRSIATAGTVVRGTIPMTARPGDLITCTARASLANAVTRVESRATVEAPRCSSGAGATVVAFRRLDASISPRQEQHLRGLRLAGCHVTVTGYVEPTPRRANDGSLSQKRADAVARLLESRGTPVADVRAGRRSIQQACQASDNRCVVVRWSS